MMKKLKNRGNDKNSFIFIIAIVSGISGILFGYDTGVISGAIDFIKPEFSLIYFLEHPENFTYLLKIILM